jgi:8-oxo-dGTP pyrophosphatase MutT (NUDIX family)
MYIVIHEPFGRTILADKEERYLEKLKFGSIKVEIEQEEEVDFELESGHGVKIIFGETVDQLFARFISNKIIIEAAGGMIFNEENKLLMIFRNGQWDMPKGKLDDGESIEDCALREVEEETGLSSLQMKQKLQITYHTYKIGNQQVIKPSHWFRMNFFGIQSPIPQTDEGITEIKWIDKSEVTSLLDLMYPSIREMVETHFLV